MMLIRVVVILLMSLLMWSCGKKNSAGNPCEIAIPDVPIKFLAGEFSYAQPDKFLHLNSDASFHWIERENYPDKGGLSVDRFEIRRTFRGFTGKLEFVFYFRRLAELRFHPDNATDFFETMKSDGLPSSNGAKLVEGDLAYWATRRGDTEQFLGMGDKRILRVTDACIAAFD